MRQNTILRSIIRLAWPTVLEQAMQTAVQYVDYAMVGRVGTSAIAAVGVTGTVTWLVNSPLWACATGFLASVAMYSGAGDTERVKRTSAQSVTVSLIFGLVMTALFVTAARWIPGWMGAEADIQKDAAAYFGIICAPLVFRSMIIVLGGVLRGAGDTRTPMLVNIGVNLTNVILNYFLIYPSRVISVFGLRIGVWGAGLGVAGAAIATAISFVLGGVSMLWALLRHPLVSPRGCKFALDGEIMRPCVKIMIPAVLQRLVTCLGQVTFASMVNSLGTIAVTAHSTAITAESAFYIPGYGMQAAASALMGNACGAKDKERMRALSRTLLVIIFCVMCITGALLFALSESVMGIFSDDAQVIRLGAQVLRMVALSEPVYGVAIIIEGIFHGVGDTLSSFVFEALCMWGVRIVGTFVTVKCLGMGLTAAWGCMIAHNVALAVLMIIRYRRGRWNPLNKTRGSV